MKTKSGSLRPAPGPAGPTAELRIENGVLTGTSAGEKAVPSAIRQSREAGGRLLAVVERLEEALEGVVRPAGPQAHAARLAASNEVPASKAIGEITDLIDGAAARLCSLVDRLEA